MSPCRAELGSSKFQRSKPRHVAVHPRTFHCREHPASFGLSNNYFRIAGDRPAKKFGVNNGTTALETANTATWLARSKIHGFYRVLAHAVPQGSWASARRNMR